MDFVCDKILQVNEKTLATVFQVRHMIALCCIPSSVIKVWFISTWLPTNITPPVYTFRHFIAYMLHFFFIAFTRAKTYSNNMNMMFQIVEHCIQISFTWTVSGPQKNGLKSSIWAYFRIILTFRLICS